MDAQTANAILTTVLTTAAGVAGYAFREYRNRTKPFLTIIKVEGDLRRIAGQVTIPVPIAATLRQAFYIRRLDESDDTDSLDQAWNEAVIVKVNADDAIQAIDRVIDATAAADSLSTQSALAKTLGNSLFAQWILLLINADKINIPKKAAGLEPVVTISYSHEEDGCVWLGFPGNATTFGACFDKTPIIKDKCSPLVDVIQHLDLAALGSVFSQVRGFLERELAIAKEVEPSLGDILQKNSRWAITLYLANLGNHPFLVGKEGHLHVEDENGAKYDEGCHLVLISRDAEGKRTRTRADSPIVVPAAGAVEFCYFTNCAQLQIKRGRAFRDAFESESARCWVDFGIQKVGLIRSSTLRSPKTLFTAGNSDTEIPSASSVPSASE